MAMRRFEIQNLYLEIQSRLGEFSQECPNQQHKKAIANLSLCLLRIKRDWIGVMDEVETDAIIDTVTVTAKDNRL